MSRSMNCGIWRGGTNEQVNEIWDLERGRVTNETNVQWW